MVKHSASTFVLRPFEGLPGETDWVAMREVVPAATGTARTTAEYGSKAVEVCTVLPDGVTAIHRTDGVVQIALQTLAGSGDTSRDLAATIIEASETEPGTALASAGLPGEGPRLQDILDLSVPFDVTMHEDLAFWLDPSEEVTDDTRAAIAESAESLIPTVKLESVESAYWCEMSREFLRWAFPYDEETLIDAIARLQARRDSALGTGKFIGAFRASGLSVPVWEFPRGTQAAELEEPAVAFRAKLDEVLAITEPLDGNERRARAGIVARQVTLR